MELSRSTTRQEEEPGGYLDGPQIVVEGENRLHGPFSESALGTYHERPAVVLERARQNLGSRGAAPADQDGKGAGEEHGVVGVLEDLGLSLAAPRGDDRTLLEKARLPFTYNSDCRGESIFLPLVEGEALSQPQIPTTLPTYDEVIGRGGLSDEGYNEHLLSRMRPEGLNVLTVHAEAEGGRCLGLFDRLVEEALSRGVSVIPLGELLETESPATHAPLVPGKIPGREGWVSLQGDALER